MTKIKLSLLNPFNFCGPLFPKYGSALQLSTIMIIPIKNTKGTILSFFQFQIFSFFMKIDTLDSFYKIIQQKEFKH
jgi:hypothetical protein